MLKPMTESDFKNVLNDSICVLINEEEYVKYYADEDCESYGYSRERNHLYVLEYLDSLRKDKIDFNKPMTIVSKDDYDLTLYIGYYRKNNVDYCDKSGLWIPYELVSLSHNPKLVLSQAEDDSQFMSIINGYK